MSQRKSIAELVAELEECLPNLRTLLAGATVREKNAVALTYAVELGREAGYSLLECQTRIRTFIVDRIDNP